MKQDQTTHIKRIAIEAITIVGSILLAFAIDAWWDEFRSRQDAEIVLNSLHDELTQVEEFMSWHDRYSGAIRNSAKQLLKAAVGNDPKLEDSEIDRLLANLTYFVGEAWFLVPELDSLVLSDDLSLVESRELRQKLKSWRSRNEFFRNSVKLQSVFVNERFIPYLTEHAFLQQISNVGDEMPGFPEEIMPIEKIELREYRSHAPLLNDPVFQNLLTRRIERMDMLLDARDEEYLSELRELIFMIEQELDQ